MYVSDAYYVFYVSDACYFYVSDVCSVLHFYVSDASHMPNSVLHLQAYCSLGHGAEVFCT